MLGPKDNTGSYPQVGKLCTYLQCAHKLLCGESVVEPGTRNLTAESTRVAGSRGVESTQW